MDFTKIVLNTNGFMLQSPMEFSKLQGTHNSTTQIHNLKLIFQDYIHINENEKSTNKTILRANIVERTHQGTLHLYKQTPHVFKIILK